MEIVGWKIVSIFSLLTIALIGVFLPILIRVELVWMDAFAAGVILVVAVMHLQAEAEESFNHIGEKGSKHGYAGAISVVTFIVMIIIQQLTIKCFAPVHEEKVDQHPHSSDAPAETKEPTSDLDEKKEAEKEPVEDASVEKNDESPSEIPNAERSHPKIDNSSSSCALLSISPCGHNHGINIDDSDAENTTSNVFGTLCFFIALGVHCVLEGVAMGVIPNAKKESFKIMFGSIFAHKGLAGFALGKTLLHAKVPWKIYAVVSTLFAIFSPLGIGIGWISTSNLDIEKSIGTAVATAIAAGTLLSVATYELIPELFMKAGKVMEKLLGITLGSGIMIILLLFIPHDHHDGEQPCGGH